MVCLRVHAGRKLANLASLIGLLVGITQGPALKLHAVEPPIAVSEVLDIEAKGLAVDRKKLLENEQDQGAKWQSGQIFHQGKWVDIAMLSDEELSPQMRKYRELREADDLDTDAHRRIAKWCEQNEMEQQSQAHWHAVLANEPNDEEARKKLGYTWIGSRWVSESEIEAAEQEQLMQIEAAKKTMPQLKKIIKMLQSDDTKTKLKGTELLEKIDSEDAVIALQFAALQVEDSLALPFVSSLKKFRSVAACKALCLIALKNPLGQSGQSALQGLKEYDEHFYVPDLLDMLELPVKIRQQLVRTGNGSLSLQQIILSEDRFQKNTLQLEKVISVSSVPNQTTPSYLGRAVLGFDNRTNEDVSLDLIGVPVQVAQNQQAKKALDTVAELESQHLQSHARDASQHNQDFQTRLKIVLSSVSGLPIDTPAEAYWEWWPAYNESSVGVAKGERTVQVLDYSGSVPQPTFGVAKAYGSEVRTRRQSRPSPTAAPIATSVRGSSNLRQTPVRIIYGSCLVAGTQVQTAEGLRSVESLEVGDLIVSTNVATGENLLKPLLLTTKRLAEETYVISLSNGPSLRATGGHYWWVNGRGWVRSRDLQSGMLIRTPDSSVEVVSTERRKESVEVFNCIVDEQHTYYAGEQRLLSWDVTDLRPTLLKAPGQDSQKLVAVKATR